MNRPPIKEIREKWIKINPIQRNHVFANGSYIPMKTESAGNNKYLSLNTYIMDPFGFYTDIIIVSYSQVIGYGKLNPFRNRCNQKLYSDPEIYLNPNFEFLLGGPYYHG